MKINFSPELFLFLKHFEATSISFNIAIPEDIKEDLSSSHVPDNFAYFIPSSSFLFNYWDTLSTIVVVFIFTLVLILITILLKKK